MQEKTVLIIDDQQFFREAVAFELEQMGFVPTMAEDGEEALGIATQGNFALILSDIRMPKWGGLKFVQEFRKLFPLLPPVIFMTGFSDVNTFDAFHEGVDAIIAKPLDIEKLTGVLASILLPLKDQLDAKTDLKPTKKIIVSYENKHLVGIGRRGFCYVNPAQSFQTYTSGDIVAFEICLAERYPFNQLHGIGEIVWVRNIDSEHLDPGIGVEFKKLDSSKIEPFLDFVHKNNLIQVIPKKP